MISFSLSIFGMVEMYKLFSWMKFSPRVVPNRKTLSLVVCFGGWLKQQCAYCELIRSGKYSTHDFGSDV